MTWNVYLAKQFHTFFYFWLFSFILCYNPEFILNIIIRIRKIVTGAKVKKWTKWTVDTPSMKCRASLVAIVYCLFIDNTSTQTFLSINFDFLAVNSYFILNQKEMRIMFIHQKVIIILIASLALDPHTQNSNNAKIRRRLTTVKKIAKELNRRWRRKKNTKKSMMTMKTTIMIAMTSRMISIADFDKK